MNHSETQRLHFTPVSTAEQIQIVADLAGPIWREAFTAIIGPEQVEYMLKDWQSPPAIRSQMKDGARYFLAMRQDQPIGYCAWSPEAQGTAKLSKFYLSPSSHGQGFAPEMLHFIETQARDNGHHTLWLQTNRANHRAIRFYLKNGFIIIRDQRQSIGEGFFIDDHIMEKPLTG
ncbi:MAG: GNAT family N-acetyltransferase [Kiritimatiellia bacterium]